MSLTAQIPIALPLARAIGTIGLGTTFGLMLSLSAWSQPLLYSVKTIHTRDRLTFWSGAYDRGSATVVPIFVAASAALIFVGRSVTTGGVMSVEQRKLMLYAAAALGLSNLPITKLFIIPTVHKLKHIEQGIAADPSAKTDDEHIDGMIKSWFTLHWIRISVTGAAFALAVSELVLA